MGIDLKNSSVYLAVDLKSFYASVECVERGLDPLGVNLVVADPTRTSNTICLAVSPALKALGIPGRPRLFEVEQKIAALNRKRLVSKLLPDFAGKSVFKKELESHEDYAIDYIVAPPRMQKYLDYSSKIYAIYGSFIDHSDIDVYSIDEVFMDVSSYLKSYGISAEELAIKILRRVFEETGITATCGIGSNLFLAKIAMDILAKKAAPNEFGVRMARLDERTFRLLLWNHEPLSDFWSIGPGIEKRLHNIGIYTMGDIARCALTHEALLYKILGVRAEFIIDHAFGFEPCTIADIKKVTRVRKSISEGQVLSRSYTKEEARVVIGEMAEQVCLNLMKEEVLCQKLAIDIGYDKDNFSKHENLMRANTPLVQDGYGRILPKPSHGTVTLEKPSALYNTIRKAIFSLYDRLTVQGFHIRRLRVVAFDLVRAGINADDAKLKEPYQTDLFADVEVKREDEVQQFQEQKERRAQEAVMKIKARFGKNAILKGNNFEQGATARERNRQIGGHKA